MNKEKVKKLFIYFVLYSIIGWTYEVLLEAFVEKNGFVNRGELFGPYCPVYGFGALAFLFTIYRLIKNKDTKTKILMLPVVFLGCTFVATTIELITSYLCEWTMGRWLWSYESYMFNFEGRIALDTSFRFGVGGVVFLYLLQPLFEKITDKMSKKVLNIVSSVLAIILLTDIIYTFVIK